MHYNIYQTDWGEVRVSGCEMRTLQLAMDVRRELRGSPFLDTEVVRRLFGRERAIVEACEAVARYKCEHA